MCRVLYITEIIDLFVASDVLSQTSIGYILAPLYTTDGDVAKLT